MALVCDYCGNVADSDRTTVAFGHNQDIALKGATARKWFYYCEGECSEAVQAMLENLRLYAMHGEGSGLVWQLAEQPHAPEADEVKPVVTEAQSQQRREQVANMKFARLSKVLGWMGPGPNEQDHREGQGTPLLKVLPHAPTTRKIITSGNVVTLEEVAALSEVEFRGIHGVGTATLEAVHACLREAGLQFADGPSSAQLRRAIRTKLGDAKPTELAEGIMADSEYPKEIDGSETFAYEELWGMVWKLWEKGICPPPMVLEPVAKGLGFDSKAAFLSHARELTAAGEHA